jgi:outer membrane protein assembly factor BamB
LSAFRRQLREAADALREACRADAKINPTPEPYRAFAQTRSAERAEETSVAATRLRYTPRWRAIIPGIDLRATFLCGDRLIVGGSAETFCLERTTGEVLWRAPTERATSVVTPGGVARLHPDGALAIHDFGTGEVTLRAWVAPRLGGPPCGAVVNVPGLPRLLILTEGERHLVAIDLTSGEARWRFAWSSATKGVRARKQGALRMKRAGKLLYFASGDSALTALDVLTGAIVWRARDRLRFRAAPTMGNDVLFAIAGGAASATRLHALDAFSGQARWTREIEPPSLCTVEGSPLATGAVVAVAVRERHALRLLAFDRESGEPRWSSATPVAPVGTSWLALDDVLVGNTPTGELVAVQAASGELRYRHVLGRVLETDTPRRLEPVLRSGALFVPHADVHVFRPHDGALLATIAPCDAIPDLLRVDERCDVYVAEESGHLVSFSAGPRLSLVR